MTPEEAVALNLKDPLVRKHVDNEIKKAIAPLERKVGQLSEQIRTMEHRMNGWLGNIQARMNGLEDRPVQALQRAKVIEMIQEAKDEIAKGAGQNEDTLRMMKAPKKDKS